MMPSDIAFHTVDDRDRLWSQVACCSASVVALLVDRMADGWRDEWRNEKGQLWQYNARGIRLERAPEVEGDKVPLLKLEAERRMTKFSL